MDLEKYLSKFDYEARKKMKIQIPELLELLKNDEVQFIDVRFKEEFELWHFSFSINIPLNEMPDRLDEINKNKLVVTACPYYDRAIMGRIFLMQNGFNARYLVEGLLGLADYLRGDNAKHFYTSLNK
ncbi:rhodanese-like domain-containing protein [Melioribacteraceae bacterium 4301-Me]|uniref:rhodanese-like domain-containing protein n=1 Tax=Pyranulibacter aquaticus TaxID=3163344 RepID=UPI0035969213